MNKEYMLAKVRQRLEEQMINYRNLCNGTGRSKTYAGSAVNRSKVKKEIQLLQLLEYLLMYCPDTMMIDNQELTDGFDRLVEPRRK